MALCCVEFNWDDPDSDRRGKEMKRATLLEVVEYVNTPGGQKIFTEATTDDVIAMVGTNIFRSTPSPPQPPGGEEVTGVSGGEDGEDEPFSEPSWPHLQLVYELLLRFIVSGEVKAKSAKRCIDTAFCSRLIEQFDTEDPRERDYLKTILHRIYGKFMSHRSHIRKAISHVFYRFVYETEKHAGIGELLEILGSIINGFALPLKAEHVSFLERALIPLHRPRGLQAYFQQLCYCISQYVEKDPTTVVPVITGLIRCWPWSSSAKQITLLNEVEEVLELAGPEAVQPILRPLFRTLARCVGSSHFQVAERALFLWNNENLLTHGILSRAHAAEVLPLLHAALQRNASGHWNATVETLAQNVLKHYMDADPAAYERCVAATANEPGEKAAAEAARKAKWESVARLAASAAAAGTSSASYALPAGEVARASAAASASGALVGGGGASAAAASSSSSSASSSSSSLLGDRGAGAVPTGTGTGSSRPGASVASPSSSTSSSLAAAGGAGGGGYSGSPVLLTATGGGLGRVGSATGLTAAAGVMGNGVR